MQDTDSVFFLCKGATLARAVEIGHDISARVNKELNAPGDQWRRTTPDGQPIYAINLEFEKLMLNAVFMGKVRSCSSAPPNFNRD